MAAKNEEIIIGQGKLGWQKGIALSPYLGFGDMRNVEVSLWPGVARCALASAKQSSTTITGIPMWFAQDIDTNQTVYCLDNTGKLYKADNSTGYATWSQVTGNTTTNAHGNGLAVWHGFIFVARDALLDVYNISGASWTSAWQTLITNATGANCDLHPMIVGTNDFLYIADGQDNTNKLGATINSLKQVTGQVFDPTNAATYTYLQNAVGANLIYGYRPSCLVQMGNNVYLGTYVGTNRITSPQKSADIYPWDRVSSAYGTPIRIKDYGINQMLTVNNVIYIQAGNLGNFYVTNGSLTQPLFTFPRNTTGTAGIYRLTANYPGAITYHKGKIFFGIQTATSGSEIGQSGIYSVNPDGTGLVLENLISTGNSNGNVSIGCLLPVNSSLNLNNDYLIGWADSGSSAQGVDLVGENNFVTSYGSTIDSQIFITGTVLAANSLQQMEIYLDRPLQSGDGIKILQRTSLAIFWSSAKTICTYDFATFGSGPNNQRWNFAIGPYNAGEMNQYQIQLTGNPSLRYIRIV